MKEKNNIEFQLCKGNVKMGVSEGAPQQNHPQTSYSEKKISSKKNKQKKKNQKKRKQKQTKQNKNLLEQVCNMAANSLTVLSCSHGGVGISEIFFIRGGL